MSKSLISRLGREPWSWARGNPRHPGLAPSQVLSEDLEEADLARIVGELLQLYALDADLT